ncbi:MAG: hydantoinase B/oxoprolinase family protein, partial [Candidatus Bathyarchaeota archaeon]|nr:hydantoinase B/oxoprolinase family protein [Candidatus Bathyarchaeota archaeon]
ASSATLSVLAERTKISPWGLYGGKNGAKGEYYIVKPNGKRIKLKSKCTVKVGKGDIFVVKTPGGGGYGNPLERQPEIVHRDVINGLVSLEAAKKDYGVAIDPVTMKINWKSTQLLRAKQKNIVT